MHIDLGRSQSYARRVIHGLRHVGRQLLQAFIEHRDRLGHLVQARIRITKDIQQRHTAFVQHNKETGSAFLATSSIRGQNLIQFGKFCLDVFQTEAGQLQSRACQVLPKLIGHPHRKTMKKFSTVRTALAFALLSVSLQAQAQSSPASSKCEFLPNAPDQHTVVRGDTLWDISGRFLQNPWCWPQVWDMNREDIKNPHWIYPNQVIYFDRAANRLRLGSSPDGMHTVKLSPGIRSTRLEDTAIPSIPAHA